MDRGSGWAEERCGWRRSSKCKADPPGLHIGRMDAGDDSTDSLLLRGSLGTGNPRMPSPAGPGSNKDVSPSGFFPFLLGRCYNHVSPSGFRSPRFAKVTVLTYAKLIHRARTSLEWMQKGGFRCSRAVHSPGRVQLRWSSPGSGSKIQPMYSPYGATSQGSLGAGNPRMPSPAGPGNAGEPGRPAM